MSDFPKYPRPLPPRTDNVDKAIVGIGCVALIVNLIFWAVVIYVAAHFILKYW